jgi:hypothetical protein
MPICEDHPQGERKPEHNEKPSWRQLANKEKHIGGETPGEHGVRADDGTEGQSRHPPRGESSISCEVATADDCPDEERKHARATENRAERNNASPPRFDELEASEDGFERENRRH